LTGARPTVVPVDLNELVDESLELAVRDIENRMIVVDLQLADAVPAMAAEGGATDER